MNGFILVNKPSGITSHDVVDIARKKLGIRKIGHCGTLDPFATGLLILLIGNTTKLAYMFDSLDKEYTGIIKFGSSYDTLDKTGKLLNENKPVADVLQIDRALIKFTGTYLQEPPIFSAIKIAGKKLYEYARKEIDIEIPKRSVTIYSLERISDYENDSFKFKTLVSSGTYIRSIARDIGDYLHEYAHLSELCRTKAGSYDLKDAVSISEINDSKVIPDTEIFKVTDQKLTLDDYMIKLIRNGVYLDERQIITEKPFLVFDNNGNLIAYYEVIKKNCYKRAYLFEEDNGDNKR